jgi:hypothetical protein
MGYIYGPNPPEAGPLSSTTYKIALTLIFKRPSHTFTINSMNRYLLFVLLSATVLADLTITPVMATPPK